MNSLESGVQTADDTRCLQRFAQVIFANADHYTDFVLASHFDAFRRTSYDGGIFLELAAVGEETFEILFVLGLNTRVVRHRTLRNATLATTVSFEDHAMHSVLAALVLCHRGIAAIGPHFHEVRALNGVAGALNLIPELVRVRVRLLLTKTSTGGETHGY